jgi:hypothetical protein
MPQLGDNQTLDWEGQVRCDEDVQAGGFNVGNLTVKVGGSDFLTAKTSFIFS